MTTQEVAQKRNQLERLEFTQRFQQSYFHQLAPNEQSPVATQRIDPAERVDIQIFEAGEDEIDVNQPHPSHEHGRNTQGKAVKIGKKRTVTLVMGDNAKKQKRPIAKKPVKPPKMASIRQNGFQNARNKIYLYKTQKVANHNLLDAETKQKIRQGKRNLSNFQLGISDYCEFRKYKLKRMRFEVNGEEVDVADKRLHECFSLPVVKTFEDGSFTCSLEPSDVLFMQLTTLVQTKDLPPSDGQEHRIDKLTNYIITDADYTQNQAEEERVEDIPLPPEPHPDEDSNTEYEDDMA